MTQPKTKIAVNCWILRNKLLDGIGNFTVQTIPIIIKSHPEIEFMILCDKNFNEDYFDFPNVTHHKVFPPYRHPLLYLFFMEWTVSRFLKKHKVDLFLSMEGFLSLSSSSAQLPVIYDLNFEKYPKDIQFKNRVYFRQMFPRFAKKAKRIATISEYSKNDIVEKYGIKNTLIDNVSCGIKDKFQPINEEEKRAVRLKYAEGKNYFFFVGSMHPRKNVTRLLEAFELFKKNTGSDMKLILSGHILWDDESVKNILNKLQYKNDIVFTGRVNDEDLKYLLGSAYCLSFVPTFEGFGLPIVEAFQSGVPVICSNTTSMPEVAGDATILVDPFDVSEIANAMGKINGNESLRSELISRGLVQKNKFTWKNTADKLYDSMMKIISQ